MPAVCIEAFCAPPWDEDAENAIEFLCRLVRNVRLPGFTAALAFAGAAVVGLATPWTTRAPFPSAAAAPQAAALGPDRTVDRLVGAREIHELAVRPAAQDTAWRANC
ncbi:hypothetical protein [Streptomyces sp. NPDC058295]|uniref:hypothetical protein n=1 Tax=Streptomyces sp. NPDC058295 TaxID=3346431 RepID=UPI0036E4B17A